MNPKAIRRYELIASASATAGFAAQRQNTLPPILSELVAIDFQTAFEVWEMCLIRGAEVVQAGLDIFLKASESKTRTLFMENANLIKLVFSSKEATAKNVLEFLAAFILSNKLETADECLMRLRASTAVDFNDAMRPVIDTVFAVYCKEHGVRVPSFNKKQRDLLLDHINKIKGPNKALLLQRMKEL